MITKLSIIIKTIAYQFRLFRRLEGGSWQRWQILLKGRLVPLWIRKPEFPCFSDKPSMRCIVEIADETYDSARKWGFHKLRFENKFNHRILKLSPADCQDLEAYMTNLELVRSINDRARLLASPTENDSAVTDVIEEVKRKAEEWREESRQDALQKRQRARELAFRHGLEVTGLEGFKTDVQIRNEKKANG